MKSIFENLIFDEPKNVLELGDSLKGEKGDRGEKGEPGPRGERGLQGEKGDRGPKGARGTDGIDGKDGVDGRDGKDGLDAKDIDLKPVFKKIEEISNTLSARGKIDQRWHGSGLSKVAHNSTLTGDGTPSNPLSVSVVSSGYQIPTGIVNGSNKIFTFATAPNAVIVDGSIINAIQSDGTVNWTGSNIITLSVAPNFNIFSVA